MTQRIHTNEILAHIMELIETNLKTSLNLVGIYRGDMNWLPPEDITNMVNGVWVTIKNTIGIGASELPKNQIITYPIRIVYIRKVDLSNNVLESKIADINSIAEMIYDNFRLATLTLSNGQVLWAFPKSIEIEPMEDNYVSSISADLLACATEIEVKVRTKL